MTWTHALLTRHGELVGVARNIHETDHGTFGTAYFIGLAIPEEIYTSLDHFTIQSLATSAKWYRDFVENEVHSAEMVSG